MSITKRVAKDGKVSYRVMVHVGYEDPIKKTGRQVITRTVSTKKEAGLVEAELRTQVARGEYAEPTKLTVGKYLDQWIATSASGRLKRTTVDLYGDIIRIYLKPELGSIQLTRLGAPAIQALYNKLAEKGLSRHTIKNVHTTLRSALKQAVRWRHIPHSPAADVDLPRPDPQALVTRKVRYLDPDQAVLFLEAARLDRWGVCLIFALVTGARPGEYLGLCWRDLDWKEGTVRVERSLIRPKGGGWFLDTPKTESSYRKVTLPAELVDTLRAHRKRQLELRLLLGPEWSCQEDFIFTNEVGGPLMEHNLNRRSFRKTLRKAGLPETFVLYDLRHTCATLLLLEGEPAKVVAERLGHSSVTQTLDTYSHVLPTMQARAAEKLRNLLLIKRA